MDPRIPLTVELKEYAKWYGARKKYQPKLIVNYICQKLTTGIGQDVMVGSILRILSTGKWIFIFDGLDEVPGDVKDKVSEEVIHFINDTLVAQKCESVCVCTSRPQGYSGQFDKLEASNVELIKLTGEQALDCAKPVLTVGRPLDEGRRDVEILTNALSTPAIREIMTSPLQAHIMAVVVRGGRKPPERRWQLFSNFYQVVKARESNRNLPDPKISKLLQEGDKVIRTLHARLGFELHARAEKSQGAATSLTRSEFRRVVEDVVSHLEDGPIGDTVDLLMSATTERLVLVSTPDSGDQVRFDIRPLQEFFAAEHIYQSGTTEEFVERVRAIGSDSHWREVLHFLLSALVENNIRTELSSAVSVMTEVNNGESEDRRCLHNTLALGALASSRLLSEGVLEQDKRIRHLFREAISPLFSSTSAALDLGAIRPIRSRQWLVDAACSTLEERGGDGAVGALLLCMSNVEDGEASSYAIANCVMRASAAVQSLILYKMDALHDDYYPGNRRNPLWVQSLIVKLLSTGEIDRFDPLAVANGMAALDPTRLDDVLRAAGTAEALLPAAQLVFSSNADDAFVHTSRDVKFGGGVETFAMTSTLTTDNWSSETWRALRDAEGVFRSAHYILNAYYNRCEDTADEMQKYFDLNAVRARGLPFSLQCYLKDKSIVSWDQARINGLGVEPAEVDDLYLQHIMLSSHGSNEDIDWISISQQCPAALAFVFDRISRMDNPPEVLKNLNSPGALVNIKAYLRKVSPQIGMLTSTKDFGEVHNVILDAALERAHINPVSIVFTRMSEDFSLNLEQHYTLLPHFVDFIVSMSISDKNPFIDDRAKVDAKLARERARAILDDPAELSSLIDGEGVYSRRTRAAALALYLLASEGGGEIRKGYVRRSPDCFDDADAIWMARALAVALTPLVVAGDVDAEIAIDRLLARIRHNFTARVEIEAAVSTWREAARAPVLSMTTQNLWRQ
jgi:hypothetical protein